MPWRETDIGSQRLRFVVEHQQGQQSMTTLCHAYGISRKCGYKWLHRYSVHGLQGLTNGSRRPNGHPASTPKEVTEALLAERRRHPTWGGKKLLHLVGRRHPSLVLPAHSTACAILKRSGLVKQRRQRRATGHPGRPTDAMLAPNDVWCVDFKGQFKTGDGAYCYPLTVSDGYSRYLICCQALTSTKVEEARPVFVKLFKKFGLPKRIRSDNGVPFATTTLARLSSLSALWVKLGIEPELIEPGKPQQNGRHERMHRTLKADATIPPAWNLRAQQAKFDAFLKEYNEIRPHESLGMTTPASLYTPSPRILPARLPRIVYPAHFEVRYVSYNGGIRWNGGWVNVSTTCAGDHVGLEEIDLGIWNVYFGNLKIGRLLEEHMRIEDIYGRLRRCPDKARSNKGDVYHPK